MQTYFLHDEEILAFCRHFLSELGFWQSVISRDANLTAKSEVVCEKFSRTLWGPVGNSGTMLFQRLSRVVKEFSGRDNTDLRPSLIGAKYDRQTKKVEFWDGYATSLHEKNFDGLRRRFQQSDFDNIVLLDMGVHTGSTMHAVYNVLRANANEKPIVSFSIYLKRKSVVVPSYWGFMVNPEDRVHTPSRAQYNEFPVNRLEHSDCDAGILLAKCTERLDFERLREHFGGDDSKVQTYTQRSNTKSEDVYWCAENQHHVAMAGFTIRGKVCRVDSLLAATDASTASSRAKNLPTTLLRWAETCARHQGCEWLELVPSETFRDDFCRMGFVGQAGSGLLQLHINHNATTSFRS